MFGPTTEITLERPARDEVDVVKKFYESPGEDIDRRPEVVIELDRYQVGYLTNR